MRWKDPFITFTFPNKAIFTIGSLVLFGIHAGILVTDLYHFLKSQRGDLMSFQFTLVLLFSHVTSFYWALLASIYTLQAEDNVLLWFALSSIALNFGLFLARFCMDYLTIEYRAEQY